MRRAHSGLRECNRQRRRNRHRQPVRFIAAARADRIERRLERLVDQRAPRGFHPRGERAFVARMRPGRVCAPCRVGLREIVGRLRDERARLRRIGMQQRTIECRARDGQVQVRFGKCGDRRQMLRISVVERAVRVLHADHADQSGDDEHARDQRERGEDPRADREAGKQGIQVHDGTYAMNGAMEIGARHP